MRLTVALGASREASFDILLDDNAFIPKWVDEIRWSLVQLYINKYLKNLSSYEQILQIDRKSISIICTLCRASQRFIRRFSQIDYIQAYNKNFN